MTTVDPTTSAAAATASAAPSAAQTQLAGNFDTFLTLLTTQLQNQDPLNPMDSNQFTQQLVAFSGVEQQINTNANLQSLIALSLSQQASSAVNYIGHSVVMTSGKGALENQRNPGLEWQVTRTEVTRALGKDEKRTPANEVSDTTIERVGVARPTVGGSRVLGARDLDTREEQARDPGPRELLRDQKCGVGVDALVDHSVDRAIPVQADVEDRVG